MSSPPTYTNPPQYGAVGDDTPDTAPLLGSSSKAAAPKGAHGIGADDLAAATLAAQAGSSRNAWMDQPADDDLPDDFKVGVNVADCDEVIRKAFVRKVYAILLVQLSLTAVVAGALMFPGPKAFIQSNPWIVIVSMIGSFASLFGVYWKRHNYPANFLILALFTVFESIMIGSVTSLYDAKVVVQALLITVGVFVGLTLFTLQTKMDFSSFGSFLTAGLFGLIGTSLVGIFLPFNQTFELIVACIGVVIFSGFILYDTQQIMKRLSVDEAIMGSLALYLDALNLFMYILRVVSAEKGKLTPAQQQ